MVAKARSWASCSRQDCTARYAMRPCIQGTVCYIFESLTRILQPKSVNMHTFIYFSFSQRRHMKQFHPDSKVLGRSKRTLSMQASDCFRFSFTIVSTVFLFFRFAVMKNLKKSDNFLFGGIRKEVSENHCQQRRDLHHQSLAAKNVNHKSLQPLPMPRQPTQS